MRRIAPLNIVFLSKEEDGDNKRLEIVYRRIFNIARRSLLERKKKVHC